MCISGGVGHTNENCIPGRVVEHINIKARMGNSSIENP